MGRNILLDAIHEKKFTINFEKDNIFLVEINSVMQIGFRMVYDINLSIDNTLVNAVYIGNDFDAINFIDLKIKISEKKSFLFLKNAN